MPPKYGAHYRAAEQDVIAWLLTQVPVPVCRELAARVMSGAHRGRALEIDRNWEIPVTLKSDAPMAVQAAGAVIQTLGGYLCVDDGGRLVVVPMTLPVEDLQRVLRCVSNIATVGVAVHFGPQSAHEERSPLHIRRQGASTALCGEEVTGYCALELAQGAGADDPATCAACKNIMSERNPDV